MIWALPRRKNNLNPCKKLKRWLSTVIWAPPRRKNNYFLIFFISLINLTWIDISAHSLTHAYCQGRRTPRRIHARMVRIVEIGDPYTIILRTIMCTRPKFYFSMNYLKAVAPKMKIHISQCVCVFLGGGGGGWVKWRRFEVHAISRFGYKSDRINCVAPRWASDDVLVVKEVACNVSYTVFKYG